MGYTALGRATNNFERNRGYGNYIMGDFQTLPLTIVQLLLIQPNRNVNLADNGRNTPLMSASYAEAAQLLLNRPDFD